MGNGEWGMQPAVRWLVHSAFRISHSAFAIFFAFSSLAVAAEPPLRPLSVVGQAPTSARPIGFDAKAIARFITAQPQVVTIDLGDLVEWGVPAEYRKITYVVLADGGAVAAETVAVTGEFLDFISASLGSHTVGLAQVRGVVFRPPASTAARDRLFQSLASATGDRDRVLMIDGDELQGTLTSLDSRHVSLQAAVGAAQVELGRVAAVVFNPALTAKPNLSGRRFLVGFHDGSQFTARSVSSKEGRVAFVPTIEVRPEDAWECELGDLVSLQTFGGRATYLSDLAPTGYKHVPYLELSRPYHLDRSADGNFLRAGRRRYAKGIGMHSTSRLSFPLDPAHKTFAAEIAIDDETDDRGSVTFRVFVDAEERFRSEIVRGGDAPKPISVDVAGGKTLSLVVDFAERGDEQDHADWLNARLLP